MTQVQTLLGARDTDVAEPSLLFELVGVTEAAGVREYAVLKARDEHRGELEALGRMEGHERDGGLLLVGAFA